MPNSYLPLCWESTGDQWWYATPIDWAAANGLCDLVLELLRIDPDLLIKLTSLRRIQRLESVWEDGIGVAAEPCNYVAQCRARVAKSILLECEPKKGDRQQHNSLIRAGYGGWLLYTAASAGDVAFVKDLLERDPLLVFGEGEYGITDILYAAARSKNSEVFRIVLERAVNVNKCRRELYENFIEEMKYRAVHAAARGGNLEILKELLLDCSDVLALRDSQGCTVLHSAAGRGQIKIVKDLIARYDIVSSTDNQGNTALHVAAYRGYSTIVEVLVLTSPSIATLRNNDGDTFLHMAVAGFRYPGFHQIGQQLELMKQLVTSKVISLEEIINIRNKEGRTALHIAVAVNSQCTVLELLMSVPSIDLNVRDMDGLTPLDLLKQCPKTATSEILMKQVASAGGISYVQESATRSVLGRNSKIQGIGVSPGISFRLQDAELFSCAGDDNESDISCEPPSSRFSSCSSEPTNNYLELSSGMGVSDKYRRSSSFSYASRRFTNLLQWPKRAVKTSNRMKMSKDDSHTELFKVCRDADINALTPLRQKFSKTGEFPSPSARQNFTASLIHGVIQATPPKSRLSSARYSPSRSFSESLTSSPTSTDKLRANHVKGSSAVRSNFFSGPLSGGRSQANDSHKRASSLSLMNQYFCFGAQGLAVEDSVTYRQANRSCRRLVF